jgi:hypothetical protein
VTERPWSGCGCVQSGPDRGQLLGCHEAARSCRSRIRRISPVW